MTDKLLDELLNEQVDYLEMEDKVLAPLLDEINLINDSGIKQFVRSLLLKQTSFWLIPSSFSGLHHPPDERGASGNVLHTKRVVRVVMLLSNSQDRSTTEKDILIAAALLHDITKGRDHADGIIRYDEFHPYTVETAVDWARMEDEKMIQEGGTSSSLWIDQEALTQILRLVRCHMGTWSPIPETVPLSTLEWMLHHADLIASKLHWIIDGDDVLEARWKRKFLVEEE